MATEAAAKELMAVKRQLAEERERHRGSEEAEREAKAVHAQLIEQMEKNYAVAQRVHEERARREESDHFAKGLREQMRSATARAVKVASELEKEKAENSRLRSELARMRSGVVRARAARGGSGLGAKIITSSEKEDARDVEEAMDPNSPKATWSTPLTGSNMGIPLPATKLTAATT